MAYRTFCYIKLASAAAVAQPVFGSWVTAISGPLSSPTLTLGTASQAGNDAANIFALGDTVRLIDPNGTNDERSQVVKLSGNTITLSGMQFAHVAGAFATGTFVLLSKQSTNVYVQLKDGNTGTTYIGNTPAFLQPGGATPALNMIWLGIKVASGSQPMEFSSALAFGANAMDSAELWISGTQNDQFLPSLGVI